MLLKNASILFGKDLTFVSSANLKISEQIFKKIKPNLRPSSNEDSIDCEGLLIIPGLINSHTHIGDSIGKDFSLNSSINAKIHPIIGAKQKILRETNPDHLSNFMKNTCLLEGIKGVPRHPCRISDLKKSHILKNISLKLFPCL